jgi:hypothetical protein
VQPWASDVAGQINLPHSYGHLRAVSIAMKTRRSESMHFSLETLKGHRLLRTTLWAHIRSSRVLVILSVPLIYACLAPFLILDLFVAIYQFVCFPIYGIPKVPRADYLIFDRGRLAYLNAIEKVGCVYCSYANGLLAYVAEITARTEQHFCPIKHAHPLAQPHSRYDHFLPYGDARAFRAQSEAVGCSYSDIARPAGDCSNPNLRDLARHSARHPKTSAN